MTQLVSHILILWLVSRDGNTAIQNGSIAAIKFDSKKACEQALLTTKQKAKYIDGICTPAY